MRTTVRAALMVVAVLALAALVIPSRSNPQAGAQDELSAQVAALETRVASLEERVAIVPLASVVPGSAVDRSDGAITISGSGQAVSEPFILDEGNYIVGVRYEGEGYVNLDIKEAPGSTGTINYATLVSGMDLPFAGEKLVEVYDTGEFVVVADGDGVFTVIIETPA